MKSLVLNLIGLLLRMTQITAPVNGSVTGIMRKADSCAPMEFACVILRNADNDTVLQGCFTDRKGHFYFRDIPAGRYYIEACHARCASVCSDVFMLSCDQSVDVGILPMPSCWQSHF